MSRREERQLLEEVHENNIMLHQICQVVNTYLSRHNVENEADFNRNIVANLIGDVINACGKRYKL